jgi:alpha-L-rhamnosidase
MILFVLDKRIDELELRHDLTAITAVNHTHAVRQNHVLLRDTAPGEHQPDVSFRNLERQTGTIYDIPVFIQKIHTGDGEAVIQPRSTWRGYQYIQITIPSHAGPLPLQNVQGIVLSSCDIPTGRYEAVTADGQTGEWVNQLFRNIQRSQLGNFLSLPTDCPQRNERMGWTGDAQVYSRTASYNADVFNFFRQWMAAVRDDQGQGSLSDVPGSVVSTVPSYKREKDTHFAEATTWAAAVCMVPWQLYSQYGDPQIIEDNLEAMVSWLNGMAF